MGGKKRVCKVCTWRRLPVMFWNLRPWPSLFINQPAPDCSTC